MGTASSVFIRLFQSRMNPPSPCRGRERNPPHLHLPTKGPHCSGRAARPEASGAPTNKVTLKLRPAPARRLERGQLCPRQDGSGGGSPEGADVPRLKSAAPSGPLCFFLRVEKEEAAWKTSCKGIKAWQERPPHPLTRELPPEWEPWSFSVRQVGTRVSGSFAAGAAVSRIHSDSRKARGSLRCGAEQGFHPCTPPGPPRPWTP